MQAGESSAFIRRKGIVMKGDSSQPVLASNLLCLTTGGVALWMRRTSNNGKHTKPDGTIDRDECTLNELSALISPYLNKGTIEFVAVQVT